MGRLFWKFFFFIWLAQLTAIWGVGSAIWLVRHNESENLEGVDTSRPVTFGVEAAAATLGFGGTEALRSLLRNRMRHPVYAVREDGQELLNRPVSPEALVAVRKALQSGLASPTLRQVESAGHTYLLFVPDGGVDAGGHPPPRLFPMVPVVMGTVASLIFAALLAWYFSKPIRLLRRAFHSVAEGHFDIRVGALMGRRRDDLADLGRDFDQMADQLQGLIEGQRRLLHDISHELRSPLARLQAAMGLVRQQPENIEPSLARMERECVRMDRLVGELLTLSKLDAGVPGTPPQTANFAELLGDVLNDACFEAQAQGKDVLWTGQASAEVQGNVELLQQAVENVVRNAVKHTPEGTTVHLESAVDASLQCVRLVVTDEGCGVPEEELGLIFEPFYRSGTQAKSTDGHGLGLAIARRALEAHGGSIRASNRVSGGLRVEMMIPTTNVFYLESAALKIAASS
ncbi:MAG: HAMP domain-containing protein [Betaproteobacteria bacterium]|nr:HAMP domain-containing protein [Betaproteobacteria bacterium]